MAELIINERVVFRIHIHNQLWNFIIISGCVVVVVELAWKKKSIHTIRRIRHKNMYACGNFGPKVRKKKYWIHV